VPRGVDKEAYFTWDNATRQDIIQRNPQLVDAKWVTPPHELGRPFPILETTLLTPDFATPVDGMNFTQSEVTPLYVGRPFVSNVTYNDGPLGHGNPILVGGFVEPFAVGSAAPSMGLGDQSSGILQVPMPKEKFTLATAIGESSWFPGAFLSSVHLLDLLGDSIDYWSPAAAANPRQSSMYMGDGGDLENVGLISLLRRAPAVKRIFLFNNPEQPLNLTWDPTVRPPTVKDIDDIVPAYFGIFTDATSGLPAKGWDYRMNHIFNASDFTGLVQKLQSGARAGTGAIASTMLTTVHNPHWGIPAGISANITWVYLSRCFGWEEELSPEMKNLIIPKKDPNNTASLITSGPFQSFPHYPTGNTQLDVEQVNLLASMTGWVVQQHPDVFTAAGL